MNNLTVFNNKVLIKLLTNYEVTEAQLAAKINLPETKIKSWVDKTTSPTYSQLIKLAEYFKKPVIIFFMDNPSIEGIEVDFRSSQEFSYLDDKKRIGELIDIVKAYQTSLEDLFADEKYKSDILKWSNEYASKQDGFNDFLRKELDFSVEKQCEFKKPSEVVEYLRDSLYAHGIYVFKESFRANDVSGLCVFSDKFPIILLNNKISFTRQLFTIFHEMYHLLTKGSHIDLLDFGDYERKCDDFAGKFLIPQSILLKDVLELELYKNDKNKLVILIKDKANYYNVSREAYLYQLVKLGVVDNKYFEEYSAKNQQYLIRSKQDDISGGNYYFTKMNYLGRAYLGDIVAKYFSGKISLRYVAQYTQMKVPNVKKMISMMAGGRY